MHPTPLSDEVEKIMATETSPLVLEEGEAAESTSTTPKSRWPAWREAFKYDRYDFMGTLFTLACMYLITSLLDAVHPPQTCVPDAHPKYAGPAWDWSTAKSHPQLQYAPCYADKGDFQCARLQLPMDYWNGTTDATISLAVVRKPAVVPVTDPRYGGAIMVNPGGPGGSGVSYLVEAHKMLSHVVDAESLDDPVGKFFDILSFDPRGVQYTTPGVQCFADLGLGQAWDLRIMEEGILGASDATFGRLWSMAVARAGTCALSQPEGEDIKPYVTTAHTARDMLSLVEHHGQWRETEAKRLIAIEQKKCPQDVEAPQSVRYNPDEEKILYAGGSYGTYLGLTFAAMFPDRVSRLIADGVVDAEDYRAVAWTDNLVDTEKEMQQFYFHCAHAGYPACALANGTGSTTAADVEARVKNITDSLLHNPLPVIGENAEVITYSDVKHLIFAGLYQPITSFPLIANLLAGVEVGNGTAFAKLLRPYHELTCPLPQTQQTLLYHQQSLGVSESDATLAIACADGDPQTHLTKDAYKSYYQNLTTLSPTIGPMWAMFRMYCIHYPLRPAHRFVGPWEAKTSHPVLLVGNTWDPVTPVSNARKMARGFEGSVVVEQRGVGHCSSAAYSGCTTNAVRAYFQTGALPQDGQVCEVDELPFGDNGTASTAGEGDKQQLSREQEVKQWFHTAQTAMLRSGGGFMGSSSSSRFIL